MLHFTAAEYQQILQKIKKQNKHHNRVVYVYEDGFSSDSKSLSQHGKVIEKYDSQKEFLRKKELELLQRKGIISELRRQVSLVIQEGFVNKEGEKQRPITYRADFMYVQDGKTVVEDVKGIDRKTGKIQTTEAFRLKWKLLQAKYPEYQFRIV